MPGSLLSGAMPATNRTLTFTNIGPFAATEAAVRHLKQRGFSVGPMQGDEPRGVHFGDVVIGKWRTISPVERLGLHGRITGDGRHGPITVTLSDDAPVEAVEALGSPVALNSRTDRFIDRAVTAGVVGMAVLCLGSLGFVMWRPIWAPAESGTGKITLRAGPTGLRAAGTEARR